MNKTQPKAADAADPVASALAESDRIVAGLMAGDPAARTNGLEAGPRGKTTPREPRTCGAKTRSGRPCRATIVSNSNGRCRMHAGWNAGPPGGNTNSVSEGLYCKALRSDELDLWARIPLGSVDEELRIAKIQLRRTLAAEARWESAADQLRQVEVDEVRVRIASGRPVETEVKHARPDYRRRALQLLKLIAHLETTRAALAALGAGSGAPEDIALRIREALRQIDEANGTAAAGQ